MQRVTLTYPTRTTVDVPEHIATLAERRTQHLLAIVPHKTMTELLRDAYLQAVHDLAKLPNTFPEAMAG